MTQRRGPIDQVEADSIDAGVAHAARMYDYLLGGGTNFAADRTAVERAAAVIGGMDNARADVWANRDFVLRAVRYLVVEAGIRQFLDIGTGIPHGDNLHRVAQLVAPDTRVVYVDHDPIVLAHAHALLDSAADGTTAYLQADLRGPDQLIGRAALHLDFDQPIAVLLAAVLHLVPDEDDPYGIVERLVDAVPAGSYLVASHLTPDFQPEAMAKLSLRLNEAARDTFVLRDRLAFERFFASLELVEPGVVQVDAWRPDAARPARTSSWVPSLYAAVGRKPASRRARQGLARKPSPG